MMIFLTRIKSDPEHTEAIRIGEGQHLIGINAGIIHIGFIPVLMNNIGVFRITDKILRQRNIHDNRIIFLSLNSQYISAFKSLTADFSFFGCRIQDHIIFGSNIQRQRITAFIIHLCIGHLDIHIWLNYNLILNRERNQQKAKEAAVKMAAKNISPEDIAEILEVSLDEVLAWTSEN